MKKIFYVMALFAAVSFVSCGNQTANDANANDTVDTAAVDTVDSVSVDSVAK